MGHGMGRRFNCIQRVVYSLPSAVGPVFFWLCNQCMALPISVQGGWPGGGSPPSLEKFKNQPFSGKILALVEQKCY